MSDSREMQMRNLLTNLRLEDKKPTQLLREMRDLAKDSNKEEFLKQLFIDRMPVNVKPLLVFGGEDLSKLAEMADKVMNTFSGDTVMAVTNSPTSSGTHRPSARDHLNQLEQAYKLRLDNICARLDKLEATTRSNHGRSRSRNRSTSRPAQHKEKGMCYYHRKFGAESRRCMLPCSYNQNQGNL